MTNRIDVQLNWMLHDSGTKFYQNFQFIATGGKTITLHHWGKYGGKEWPRPVEGGEIQIKQGMQLTAKTQEKRKRGYKIYDVKDNVRKKGDSWFTETFGAKLAWELQNAMFGVDSVALDPSPAPDTSIVPGALAPIIERPSNWGTW